MTNEYIFNCDDNIAVIFEFDIKYGVEFKTMFNL